MPLEINKDFALLYGIMLGDGCLSKYGRHKMVSITGSLEDDIPFFEKVIQPILWQLIDRNVPIKTRKNCKAVDFKFMDCSLFSYFANLGYPVGKKGNKLFIPKIFYEKDLVRYLVQGFFATDGSLVITDNNGTMYPRVEANGIAKILITEISDWINSKGIKCNLYLAKRRPGGNFGYSANRQDTYRVQINGKKELNKFIQEVGFVNPKQIERLRNYMAVERIELSTSAL